MEIQKLLIPELEHEVALTEKFLRRIPKDKLDWRPHPKSMSIKQLGSHLAELPSWVVGTMSQDEMIMDEYKPPINDNVDEMIKTLKSAAKEAADSLKVANSEYDKKWKMIQGGKTVMEMPKYQVLRGMVLNQFPHHRAQLGVCLRLLNESVPATYGPSADEQ
ncbi:DinB family protein [Arenibacter sp. F20364]|uniref:DinB family protein n=1 Tax=Arenibacter sp. F20364 TaxID=2926415 RepID=UPI001FF6E9AC|nr:DinB family protein [Arenibacter sp. F20364]MCK0189408.1 DinB family protein [Arenibacter sp. F20364]|tara:strand:- start:35177 stop:35662 length:486 start_codon:yes stop_codon:yes gene_type:complete